MKSHNLFPEKVKLNEELHKYFDDYGQEYIGFSRFSSLFLGKPFQADLIAGVTAKSEGVDKSVVLDRWQQQTDDGTKIDKALELAATFGVDQLPEEYFDIKQLVDDVLMVYKDYHSCYEQVVTYNEYMRIAGSPDKFALTSSRKDGSFIMSDYKCFVKGTEDLYLARGWMDAPFNHLPKTKYHKIAMQLSYYSFQLEELLGKRCKQLFIHLIDPINKTHQQIPVPYLKTDIQLCLEMNKEKILLMTTPIEDTIF